MEGFIGATDSAVPCAFLMYAALALDKYLVEWEEKLRSENDDLEEPMGLQVRFFSFKFDGGVDGRLFSLMGRRR